MQLRISLYFRLQLIDKLERNLYFCWKSLKQIPSKWQFYYPNIFIPFVFNLIYPKWDVTVMNLQNVRWNLKNQFKKKKKSKWQLLLKPASWVLHFSPFSIMSCVCHRRKEKFWAKVKRLFYLFSPPPPKLLVSCLCSLTRLCLSNLEI